MLSDGHRARRASRMSRCCSASRAASRASAACSSAVFGPLKVTMYAGLAQNGHGASSPPLRGDTTCWTGTRCCEEGLALGCSFGAAYPYAIRIQFQRVGCNNQHSRMAVACSLPKNAEFRTLMHDWETLTCLSVLFMIPNLLQHP